MFTFSITVTDIQPKNVRSSMNPNNDNKIRRAWVLQMPQSHIPKIKALSQEARFDLYASIDQEVSDKWIEIMRRHNENNKEHTIVDKFGNSRLSDLYCVDADEQLIEAANIVMMSFAA